MVGVAHSLAGFAKDHLFHGKHEALVVFGTGWLVISQVVALGKCPGGK